MKINKLLLILFLLFINSFIYARVHTVKSGENLTSIARLYNTTVSELKRLNNLSSDFIREGQKLTLPYSQSQEGLYVVKSGETLSGLASRYNTTVSEIKGANNLTSDFIREGQRLVIPGHYPQVRTTNQTTQVQVNIQIPEEEKIKKPMKIKFSYYIPSLLLEEIKEVEVQEQVQVVEVVEDNIINNILNSAIGYMGIKYVYGGETSQGFDCSGFVYRVYADNGISLGRTVTDMEAQGIEISRDNLVPGDLIIFYDPKHVGIYLGNNRFIHSSSYRNRGVVISSLDRENYKKRYHSTRRIIY